MSEPPAESDPKPSRNPLYRFVPFGAQVFLHKRLRDWRDFRSPDKIARTRGDAMEFPILVSEKSSSLKCMAAGGLGTNTEEKTQNLRLGSARLNGLVITLWRGGYRNWRNLKDPQAGRLCLLLCVLKLR
jgi:hypothetical protein